MDADAVAAALPGPARQRRVLLALLVPADSTRPVELVEVADSSTAISDVLGGGLIDQVHDDAFETAGCHCYGVDASVCAGLPVNPRAMALAERLALGPGAVGRPAMRGDVLIVGAAAEQDTHVPGAVLAIAAMP